MKILLLADYYQEYLNQFYQKNDCRSLKYQEHLDYLVDDYFGSFGSYYRHLQKLGHQVALVIGNDYQLQNKWISENSLPLKAGLDSKKKIVLEQIRKFSPDIVFMGSMFDYYGEFLKEVSGVTKNIFTWIACPFPKELDYSHVKCVLSSTSFYVEKFKNIGLNSHQLGAGFDNDIPSKLSHNNPKYDLSFIGGLSAKTHSNRVKIIKELIAKKIKIDLFGYGLKKPIFFWQDRTMYYAYHGQLWGLSMYQTLKDSLISLNIHIDVAGGFAGNMRMYEATGCGSLLFTEMTDNLPQIFDIKKEVVGYTDQDDLEKKLEYFLNHPDEAKSIADNGKKACHQNFGYNKRVVELAQIFTQYAS